MRIQGRTSVAVATAAALLVTSGTAAAAAPPTTPIASDVRDKPAVTGSQVVYATTDGAVRIVDAQDGAESRELTRGCAPDPRGPVVEAASGGYALLNCLIETDDRSLVLDLASGALFAPTASDDLPSIGSGDRVELIGIAGTSLCYEVWFDKAPSSQSRLSRWSTDVPAGPTVPCARIGRDVVTADGIAVSAEKSTRTVTLARCGATLRWSEIALSSNWQAVPDGLVITDGEQPLTIGYSDLGEVCAGADARWRLTLRADGRSTTLTPVRAAGSDKALGARIALAPRRKAPVRRAFGNGRATVTLPAAARSLRWRLGGGRVHAARGAGRSWRLTGLPARRGGTLGLELRARDGSVASYRVRLR